MKNKKTLFLIFFLFFSPLVCAQSVFVREQAMESTLSAVEIPARNSARTGLEASSLYREQTPDEFRDQEIPPAKKTSQKPDLLQEEMSVSQERDNLIETTINKLRVEMSLEYLFAVGGQQKYDIYNDTRIVSRQTFSFRGQMPLLKGEVHLTPRFSIGGRLASGKLRRRVASDEDWRFFQDFAIPPAAATSHFVDYQIEHLSSRSSVEFFDLNLYYRLMELDKEDIKQREGKSVPRREGFWNGCLPDDLAFDASLGYQHQKSRSTIEDPWYDEDSLCEGRSLFTEGLPANIDMNSYYKTFFQGPKVGCRSDITFGKFTTSLNLSYVWLHTKAYGWWNIKHDVNRVYTPGAYTYEQNGSGGWGVDVGAEVTYKFNPHLSAGLGIMCLYSYQGKMKESGNENGVGYEDSDIIRNTINRFYSPSLILKFAW